MNKLTPEEVVEKFGLSKLHWIKKGFHGVLHYHYVFWQIGFNDFEEFFGEKYTYVLDFFSGSEKAEWYLCHEDAVRIRESLLSKVRNDDQWLYRLVKEWEARKKDFDKLIEEIEDTDLSKLDNLTLYKYYSNFNNQYIHTVNIAIVAQDPFSMTAEEYLVPHFKKVLSKNGSGENFIQDFALLMSPVDQSFLAKEEYELATLFIKKNNGEITSDELYFELKTHVKNYHWIQNNYSHVVRLDEDYFSKKLDNFTEIEAKKIVDNYNVILLETKRKKQEIISLLNLDDWSKTLISMVETFSYMQDVRKMYMMKANSVIRLFMEEFGNRLNINYQDMKWTHIDELLQLFDKTSEEKSELIARRKVGSAFIGSSESGVHVFDGADTKKLYDLIIEKDNDIQTSVKGVVACKGKVVGKARVIHTISDLPKMLQGEILVASMTRPEMVSVMKLAAAIVTDEGGITSHAAVVSRELNVPCVIGTKHATQIFKDGDMLEVDANSGVVKKI